MTERRKCDYMENQISFISCPEFLTLSSMIFLSHLQRISTTYMHKYQNPYSLLHSMLAECSIRIGSMLIEFA